MQLKIDEFKIIESVLQSDELNFLYKIASDDFKQKIISADVVMLELTKRRKDFNKKQKENMREKRYIDKDYGRHKKN